MSPKPASLPRGFFRRALVFAAAVFATLVAPHESNAFTHIVSQGETLAEIATRVYGASRFETAIASANALDVHGGSAIVAGQPLEIPAPSHHRVVEGDVWPKLASIYLGDASRAEVLARANAAVSWVPPAIGQEIEVPAVVGYIAGEGETMPELAQRYWNNMNRAWELNAYNHRSGEKLLRGDVILIPLLDLHLTAEGKKEAFLAAERTRTEGGGQAHEAQRRAEADIPPLVGDVRTGRYIDAVVKGNRLLGTELTKPQLAAIHRALVEAFVALDATGLAAASCAAWRANSGDVRLDARTTSPKIRAACGVKDATP
ncbi:MAG: LysM peptidoglycan-binding domain-containing protein [Polyangiaceae bacterium]|nr:LysM peptidoglycan-binding domain-containing protein [Polyangiaceae bacterium]